jgi:DedD protein
MSAENKKLLWIAIAVVAVVLVLAGTAVAFFYPRKGGGPAPAAVGNTAAPKAADPQDYLSAPQLLPPDTTAQGKAANGDVIVIYGDKPEGLSAMPGEGEAAIAATAATATTAGGGASGPAAAVPGATADPGQGPAGASQTPAVKAPAPKASPAKPAKTVAKTTTQKAPSKALAPADQYWIQAASFASRGKADELKDVLGKTWYRVRVGPYISNAEAAGWLTRVKAVPGCEEAGIWKGSATAK